MRQPGSLWGALIPMGSPHTYGETLTRQWGAWPKRGMEPLPHFQGSPSEVDGAVPQHRESLELLLLHRAGARMGCMGCKGGAGGAS